MKQQETDRRYFEGSDGSYYFATDDEVRRIAQAFNELCARKTAVNTAQVKARSGVALTKPAVAAVMACCWRSAQQARAVK